MSCANNGKGGAIIAATGASSLTVICDGTKSCYNLSIICPSYQNNSDDSSRLCNINCKGNEGCKDLHINMNGNNKLALVCDNYGNKNFTCVNTIINNTFINNTLMAENKASIELHCNDYGCYNTSIDSHNPNTEVNVLCSRSKSNKNMSQATKACYNLDIREPTSQTVSISSSGGIIKNSSFQFQNAGQVSISTEENTYGVINNNTFDLDSIQKLQITIDATTIFMDNNIYSANADSIDDISVKGMMNNNKFFGENVTHEFALRVQEKGSIKNNIINASHAGQFNFECNSAQCGISNDNMRYTSMYDLSNTQIVDINISGGSIVSGIIFNASMAGSLSFTVDDTNNKISDVLFDLSLMNSMQDAVSFFVKENTKVSELVVYGNYTNELEFIIDEGGLLSNSSIYADNANIFKLECNGRYTKPNMLNTGCIDVDLYLSKETNTSSNMISCNGFGCPYLNFYTPNNITNDVDIKMNCSYQNGNYHVVIYIHIQVQLQIQVHVQVMYVVVIY